MLTRLLTAFVLVVCLHAPAAQAAPVTYVMTFTPVTGPAGTGMFTYDEATGLLTGFQWDFGAGLVGNVADIFFAADFVGDTRGSFLFEMLTQTEAHDTINCIGVFLCEVNALVQGAAPGGAWFIQFIAGPPTYAFRSLSFENLAHGSVSVTRAISEPASLALLWTALCVLAMVHARTARGRPRSTAG